MKLVFKSPFSDIFNVLKMSSFLLKAQLSPAVNTPVGLPLELVPEDAPDLAIGHAQPGLCHSDMGLLIFLEEIPNSSNVSC